MEKIKEGDFVEIDFTGRVKSDNYIFDTTSMEVAKENRIFNPQLNYGPVTVCVGKGFVLGGLDKSLVDMELGGESTINIPAESAFGKKNPKLLKLISLATFKKHKIQPKIGLQVTIDNSIGIVRRISGGRVIVDFNHPLSGKELAYKVNVLNKVEDKTAQVASVLTMKLNLKKENYSIDITDDAAEIRIIGMPAISEGMIGPLEEFVKECTSLKGAKFIAGEESKKAE